MRKERENRNEKREKQNYKRRETKKHAKDRRVC